jgi:hypothetical protein
VLSQDIPALEVGTNFNILLLTSPQDFQKRYGDKELCCMLAILAAGLTPVNEIGFSYYDFLEPQVVSLALKHLYSYGGQPVLAGMESHLTQKLANESSGRGNVTFSPLHDGYVDVWNLITIQGCCYSSLAYSDQFSTLLLSNERNRTMSGPTNLPLLLVNIWKFTTSYLLLRYLKNLLL